MKSRCSSLPANIVVLSIALLAGLEGCRAPKPISISATVPFALFVKSRTAFRMSGRAKGGFSFPYLEIYNAQGGLIYAEDNAYENSQKLETFPVGLDFAKVLASDSGLRSTVSEITAFSSKRQQILDSHKVCILLISVDGCDACSFQTDALKKTEARLLQNGVNILKLHISMPES